MAELARKTFNNGIDQILVDADPIGGIKASKGSIAFGNIGGSPKIYIKNGAADTDWGEFNPGSGDILEKIESFDDSLGYTTGQTINGYTSRLTHDGSVTQYAEKTIVVTPKYRSKNLMLFVDILTTAASGNFKVIITDETNASAELLNEVLTPQTGSIPSKKFATFSTASNTASIKVRFEALAESGSPTSDFDDIIIQLTTSEKIVSEVYELEENEFSARIANDGAATVISQSSSFIQSVSRVAVGQVDVVFVTDFFSETPNVTITAGPQVSSVTTQRTQNQTATGFQAVIQDVGSTIGQDVPFNIHVSRQGADRKNLTRKVEREVSSFQEVLVQESDSAIRLTTGNGFGSTNGSVRRFANIEESKGLDIQYEDSATLGTSFTIVTSGVYSVSYTDQAGANGTMGITRNSTDNPNGSLTPDQRLAMTSYDTTNGDYNSVSWVGNLVAGDVIRATATSASSGSTRSSFTISKQGSLKVAQTAPDSKIEIPSTQIKLNGSTSRGSTDQAIVRFDNIEIIRGDHVEVASTVANGTSFTVKKKGKLTIDTSIYFSSPTIVNISKNQTDLSSSTVPVTENIGGSSFSSVAQSVSATTDVEAGDVIRISASNAPATLGTIPNQVRVRFEETKISVSVSNIAPQFDDMDSSVRVTTTNGFGSTGTRIRRFSSVVDNIGVDVEYADSAVDGATFTAKSDGIYEISYTDIFSTATFFAISKNSSSLSTDASSLPVSERLASNTTVASSAQNIAWGGYLNAGDIIRPHTNVGTQVAPELASFTMSKVGKPSINTLDVTPFVETPQTISQGFRINTFAGHGSTNTQIPYFNGTYYESGAKIIAVENSPTNGFSMTALMDCVLNADVSYDANIGEFFGFSLNSTQLSTGLATVNTNDRLTNTTMSTGGASDQASISIRLKKGDVVRPHSNGAASAGTANRYHLNFTAIAQTLERVYNVAQVENEFSARIANNSVATITSQSSNFIQSVNRSALGKVTVTFVPGFFTEIPSLVASYLNTSTNAGEASVVSVSTVEASIETFTYSTGAFQDINFNIHLSRQGSDRKDLTKAIVKLDEFPRVNRNLTQNHTIAVLPASMTTSVGDLRWGSPVVSGDNILEYDDSTGFFTAIKSCRVNVSCSLRSTNANANFGIFKGGNRISTLDVSPASFYGNLSAEVTLNKGEYIVVNSALALATVNQYLNIVAEADDLERVTDLDLTENHFTVRIANDGATATVVSQNGPNNFIQSVSRTAAGRVTINFVSGFFTEVPSLVGSVSDDSTFGNYLIEFDSVTTTSALVRTFNTGSATVDVNFDVNLSRQGSDYKSIQDVAAVIFTPKIAYLKDVKASGTVGGTASAAVWQTRNLNAITGDSSIVSLSANQFTLQPGEYDILAKVPSYAGDSNKARLKNVTDNTYPDGGTGSSEFSWSGGNGTSTSFVECRIVLTEAKTFVIEHYVATSSGPSSLGFAASIAGVDEVYTQVKIIKIA